MIEPAALVVLRFVQVTRQNPSRGLPSLRFCASDPRSQPSSPRASRLALVKHTVFLWATGRFVFGFFELEVSLAGSTKCLSLLRRSGEPLWGAGWQ